MRRLAETWLTCGSRSGAGRRPRPRAPRAWWGLSAGSRARLAPAANIYLHAGDTQQGATGEPFPLPLAVLVTDLASNPVEGMAVTFSVTQGDGKLGGQSSVVVTTNAKGVADVAFVPGEVTGYSAHRVLAQIPPVEGSLTDAGVTFTLSAFASGPPEMTRVSGVVVDQDEAPLEGVAIRFPDLEGAAEVFTAADGTFTYPGAPPGFARMVVDGATVPYEGETPRCE